MTDRIPNSPPSMLWSADALARIDEAIRAIEFRFKARALDIARRDWRRLVDLEDAERAIGEVIHEVDCGEAIQ